MRKKFFILAIGIAASMTVGGCLGKGAETSTEAVWTEAGTGETESSSVPESSNTPESGSMPEGEEESSYAKEDLGTVAGEESPLKITGKILEAGEGTILVDGESDAGQMGEIMLLIDPENTLVLDGANGFPVEYKDIETGSFEAYLGSVMTMSLPPQTTPYVVIVNIPEGEQAPEYVVAGGKVEEAGGKRTLTGADETEYPLADSVDIKPYLTRNIVRLEDIDSGSRCLVWTNEDGEADRIVLFGE